MQAPAVGTSAPSASGSASSSATHTQTARCRIDQRKQGKVMDGRLWASPGTRSCKAPVRTPPKHGQDDEMPVSQPTAAAGCVVRTCARKRCMTQQQKCDSTASSARVGRAVAHHKHARCTRTHGQHTVPDARRLELTHAQKRKNNKTTKQKRGGRWYSNALPPDNTLIHTHTHTRCVAAVAPVSGSCLTKLTRSKTKQQKQAPTCKCIAASRTCVSRHANEVLIVVVVVGGSVGGRGRGGGGRWWKAAVVAFMTPVTTTLMMVLTMVDTTTSACR